MSGTRDAIGFALRVLFTRSVPFDGGLIEVRLQTKPCWARHDRRTLSSAVVRGSAKRKGPG